MNWNFIYCLLIIFPIVFIAQTKNEALINYNLGVAAFTKKDYKKADSLFTLSLSKQEHIETYYQRALCRKNLANFNGYCVDLGSAYALGDPFAKELYWKECAKGDTIYRKNNIMVAGDSDFDTVEFIYKYAYNGNFKYDKYDNLGKLLISYIVLRTDTIFEKCANAEDPQYRKGLKEFGHDLLLNTKFGKYVKKKKINGKINLSLVISETGKVIDVQVSPSLKDGISDTLVKDLLRSPLWQPAFFNGRYVKYELMLGVYYSEFGVNVYPILPKLKSLQFKIVHKCDTTLLLHDDEDKAFAIVDTMPEFPGGINELSKFVQQNLIYPVKPRDKGIQGKCFLKFVVNSDGSICDITVMQGVPNCNECDQEAIRVIQSMPKWNPGKQNGHAVPVFFYMPFNFQLR